jgi:formylglycine-generating enzyme required for sulfatase activity
VQDEHPDGGFQAQWEAVMTNNLSRFKGNPNHPAASISWLDVQVFLCKFNKREGGGYRLPTEAQWEYACRAGTETPHYHQDIDAIAWYGVNSGGQTHPVGQKLPNAWGLYNMLGNVYEWCHDGRRTYISASVTDPIGPTDADAARFVRGGAWDDARHVRTADRFWVDPGDRLDILGFRCSSSGFSK